MLLRLLIALAMLPVLLFGNFCIVLDVLDGPLVPPNFVEQRENAEHGGMLMIALLAATVALIGGGTRVTSTIIALAVSALWLIPIGRALIPGAQPVSSTAWHLLIWLQAVPNAIGLLAGLSLRAVIERRVRTGAWRRRRQTGAIAEETRCC